MAVSKHALQDELDDELSCSLCCERYDMENRAPKVLPCQHTYCYLCLVQYEGTSFDTGFPCPTCKRATHLDERGIGDLPNNLTIISLIERMKMVDQSPVCKPDKYRLTCGNHQKNAEHICMTCTTLMCSKCILENMNVKGHDGHDIIEVEQAFDDAIRKLNGHNLEDNHPLLSIIKKCEASVSTSDAGICEMKHKIENRADEAINKVLAWKSEALQDVDEADQDKNSTRKSKLCHIRQKRHELDENVSLARASVEKGDIVGTLFTMHAVESKAETLSTLCNGYLQQKEISGMIDGPMIVELGNVLIIKETDKGPELPQQMIMPEQGRSLKPQQMMMPKRGQSLQQQQMMVPQRGQSLQQPQQMMMPKRGQSLQQPQMMMPKQGQSLQQPQMMMSKQGQSLQQPQMMMPKRGQSVQQPQMVMPKQGQSVQQPQQQQQEKQQQKQQQKQQLPQQQPQQQKQQRPHRLQHLRQERPHRLQQLRQERQERQERPERPERP